MRHASVSLLALLLISPAAQAWDADVHRTITYTVLESLGEDAPVWLRDVETQHRVAFQANQVDRWRSSPSLSLKHENDPDHYLDAELLDQFGLTLETIPRLRGEYLRAMVVAKVEHPEKIDPYDPAKDTAHTHEWPGFVLHAVAEHYAKFQAALVQVRILEQLNEPARAEQLAQARAIAVYHLGNLSHFVADIAQPLHTTKHYNGWVGENPAGYKWRDHFHAYIDGGLTETHHLGIAELRPVVQRDVKVNAADPWEDVLKYFARSNAQVEPLYALERDGKLDGPEGRAFALERLGDASSMLRALVQAACTSSATPTDEQVKSWVRYNAFDPSRLP
ncbi:MAG: hypothetical protein PVJ57_18915 [Phycisphaerae bacterium]|jgi:hypothetical protein